MPAASLILLIAQVLPTLVNDYATVAQLFDASSAALKTAQAGKGTISAADWQVLDGLLNGDLATLAKAAGVATPITVTPGA